MKKVMKKFNRALSIMLVAAMVLTMAPQTAMPVLAAEAAVDETVTPDVPAENDEAVVEETVETPENGDSEEIAAPSDEENIDTEGDDIANEDPAEEDPATEEPSEGDVEEPSEEEIADPAADEEEEDLANTANAVEIMEDPAALKLPEFTVKRNAGADDETTLKSGDKVPFGTDDITFTLSAAEEGAEIYYLIGEGDPYSKAEDLYKDNKAKKYTAGTSVPVTAPTAKTETTCSIQAIQVIPGTDDPKTDPQYSAIAAFRIIFEAKVNKITVADGVSNVAVKVSTDANKITNVLGADGYALDSNKDLYLTAAVTGEDAATKEVDQVLYATQETVSASGFAWFTEGALATGVKPATLDKGKYTIPKDDLGDDLVLNVTTKAMPTISFDAGKDTKLTMFTVNATLAGKDIDGWKAHEFKGTNDVIAVPSGSVVKLTISPANSCALTNAVLKEVVDGAKETTIEPKSGKITIDFNATTNVLKNNYTVTVTATESYKGAVITDDKGKTIDETKAKTWTVDPRKDYTISAVQGGGTDFFIDDAKINPEVTGATIEPVKKDGDETGENGKPIQVNAGKYLLHLDAQTGGKAVKVDLYDTEGAKKDTITINVRPVIGKDGVTVAGVKNGKLQQIIDTEKTYAVTLEAKESTDTLGVKMAKVGGEDGKAPADSIDTLDIEKNEKTGVWELKIKTKVAAAQTDAAEISITNITGLTTDEEIAAAPVVATFTLDTIVPAWSMDADKKGGAAPTVKLVSATDIDLNLSLTAPKNVKKAEGTKFYYKVNMKPQTEGAEYVSGDRYYEVTAENIETIQQKVNAVKEGFGSGKAAKFDVTVQLLQYIVTNAPATEADEWNATDGSVAIPEGAVLIASSKEATLKNAATKAPYYADKITLKKEKAASGVYTGQTIAVATVDFGKDTTYNRDEDVKAWVVGNESNDSGDDKVSVQTYGEDADKTYVKDGKVTLVVGKNVKPGKIKIKVEQTSGSGIPVGAVPASATMDVTVVQGIKVIEATSQSTIYVQEKKATSAKIAIRYIGGDAAVKPKTAKVGYTVGTVTTTTDNGTTTKTFNPVEIKGVSVKNGTVSITKDFDANTTKAFAVQVYADDYHNADKSDVTDDRSALVEYTVVTDKQELGKILLLSKENDVYTPVPTVKDAKNKDVLSITADKAASTTVRVLDPKVVEEKTSYTEADFVPTDLYALTFSKKNDIELNGDALKVKKPVDKVKVTAQTTDGGKQKATNSLEFSVTYEKDVKAKLQIKKAADYEDFESKTATVTSTTSTIINIRAIEETTNKDFKDRLVDYKITAGKGAKIVSGAGTLEVGVQLTAEEATLNLTDMKGKNPVPYTIKNGSFKLDKAPKVSVAKGEKLRAGDKNTADQSLKFTVAKLSKDAKINAVKVSVGTDKDSQELGKKLKSTDYVTVEGLTTSSNGTFTLDFGSDLPVIKKATLYFDFYCQEENPDYAEDNGQEKLITTLKTQTSAAVTVKTETIKKAYKLTNKYTMSEKDRASVTLSASKPSGVKDQATQVKFTGILNANIKGTVNGFVAAKDKDGAYTGDGAFDLKGNKLVLINPDKASKAYGEDKKNKIKGINNLIGFVKYTVTYDDKTTEDFITQITVNMLASDKVAVKPTATKASILNAAEETTTITVKAGKDEVELVYAELDGEAKGLFTMAEVEKGNKGTVTLTLKAAVERAGSKKGTLKVVLADSFYAPTVKDGVKDTSTDDEKKAYADALDKAVIEVPVTIDVKALTTKNKVKIDSKDQGLNFKEAKASDGKYTKTIPYTPVVSAKVSIIEAVYEDSKSGKELTPSWIKFEKAGAANTITITIDQVGYASYVKTGGSDLTKNKINGKAVDATVKFTYAAAGAEADQVKIKITPPTIDENVLAMAKDQATVEISCTGDATTVAQEGELQFTATVKVGDQTVNNGDVTWTLVETDVKTGTTIDANGKLTVDADEEVDKTLTIKAEAKNYIGSATKTVTVTAKAAAGGGAG